MPYLILFFMLSSAVLMAQTEVKDNFYIEGTRIIRKNGWVHSFGGSTPYRMCDGKRCEGLIVDTYESGQVKHVGFYENGYLNGEVIDYYENGQIETIRTCDKGRGVGIRKMYYESGQLSAEIYRPKGWNMREPQKTVGYFEDGSIEDIEEYSDDYRLLYSCLLDEDKDTFSLCHPLDFENHIYEHVDYHDNGERKEVGIRQFIEGEGWKDVGSWLFFDEEGKLTKVIDYLPPKKIYIND